MSFKDQLKRFRSRAERADIPSQLVAPVPYEALWAIGVPIMPPLHQSWIGRILTMGIPTGVAFGLGLGLIPPESGEISVLKVIGQGIAFGAVFGVAWAVFVAVMKTRYDVPAWSVRSKSDKGVGGAQKRG